MTDLLNDFAAEIEREKHLSCYRGMLRRARPYTLDDDATALITELASGQTINDKLATYRILARLPFETVWIEMNYDARYYAQVALGTSYGEKPKDVPDRMGWLMERLSDTTWRATTVVRYNEGVTKSGRNVDTFGATHVISTEGPLQFRSFIRDPVIREAVMEMNQPEPGHATSMIGAVLWGFGDPITLAHSNGQRLINISLPRHLEGCTGVDLPLSWEPLMQHISKGKTNSEKKALVKKHMMDSAVELQGDLRFLMAALATINEVPVNYAEHRQEGVRRIGGQIRPYMVNRVVTIAIPKKRGRTNKVMKMLRLAEVRMRRHEVSGYWKRVHFGDGRVELKWIKNYWRGDAALGYVNQEREVVEA
jgi:hypothetical protein